MKITDIEIEEPLVPEETTELTVSKRIEEVMARMEQITVNDMNSMQAASAWLTKNKETQKFVKDFFEPERKRTYKEYKAVTDQIKVFTDTLTKGERIIKKKMADYQTEQDRIRREAEAKRLAEEETARKKAEEEGTPVPETVVVTPAPEPEKVEGVSFVENWTFEIEDKAKIPLEYMIPDEKKIRQVVKAMKADTNIPGIKAYAEKTVRAR